MLCLLSSFATAGTDVALDELDSSGMAVGRSGCSAPNLALILGASSPLSAPNVTVELLDDASVVGPETRISDRSMVGDVRLITCQHTLSGVYLVIRSSKQ
jgi:hypothetical protein